MECAFELATLVMKLYVNGDERASWMVNITSYANYTVTTPLTGRDQIDIVFTNDYYQSPEDRNLYVDYVTVGGRVALTHPNPPSPKFRRGRERDACIPNDQIGAIIQVRNSVCPRASASVTFDRAPESCASR
jgi:hypothetical protein